MAVGPMTPPKKNEISELEDMVKLPSRYLEEVQEQNLNPYTELQFVYQLKIFTKQNIPAEEV
jgi:hypothetical protein